MERDLRLIICLRKVLDTLVEVAGCSRVLSFKRCMFASITVERGLPVQSI